MFRRWLSPVESSTSAVPAGLAVYAIGDIHGRLDLVTQLLAKITDDSARHPEDRERRLIFLGDYIDRGMQSRAVVDFLLAKPGPGFASTFLMGNHEDAMLEFLEGRSDGRAWLSYGGLETLMSYGVPVSKLPFGASAAIDLRKAVRQAVPATHVDFMRNCTLSHTEGDFVFVHAGIRPGRSMEQQTRHDLLWIRDDFLHTRLALPGKVVVHGHTICDEPKDLGHRIDIDTGAFVSGRLTCLVVRGTVRRFLTTNPGLRDA
jgi:serine/threonine protein phosphatase 1